MAATRRAWAGLVLAAGLAQGAILPEERGDAMYHRYDGGGVTVDGPAVLVRKNFEETYSLNATYYVDNVSSASIDVITTGASPYGETRTEYSLGGDYLHDKSIIGIGYSNSDESDYTSDTWYFNVSQDFFGDLTTLTFGYSQSQDDVYQNGNPDFAGNIDRHNYRVGLSQVITPELILSLGYELVTDEGYLNNPYRSYRYLTNPQDPAAGYQFAQEVYPTTHTSDAAALRLMYYLNWRATVGASYRYYTDDWGIDGNTFALTYTHTLYDNWIFDIEYRYYEQSAANFYSDLFQTPSQDSKDYRGRDKELSNFNDQTLSLQLSYSRPVSYRFADRAALSMRWDRIWFDYEDFRNLEDTAAIPGEEPLYNFEADIYRLVFTLWY
ncbi:MAG: DUF3570 domain-containing protein [Pseudomonadales bacterium]|nr:DUF3570 domain-containing protein [Pseudomonadales bacterium]